jgi:deoxycytidine triphosphate deaminase
VVCRTLAVIRTGCRHIAYVEAAGQSGVTFAPTDSEAESRFSQYQSLDPFPEIEPALLNSADIADYVAATGLIWPFRPEGLKSASYAVRLLGETVFWDDKGKPIAKALVEEDDFILQRNSIAFVTLEPMFRLPDYIALRFNLKIPNVYRGLLLGTGPLVDPGWTGRLSIPLHNLTTNDYTFKGGEELIWVEFTKLSRNQLWANDEAVKRHGTYIPFPKEKRGGDVRSRLANAVPNRPVSSSLGDVLVQAEQAAKRATDAQTTARNLSRFFSFAGGTAIVVGLATIVMLAYQVYDLKQRKPASNVASSKFLRINSQVTDLQRRVRLLERGRSSRR